MSSIWQCLSKCLTPVVAALTGAAISAILVYVWMKKGFASSEMASWVQAIGSIGALVGAFVILEKQSSHSLHLLERQKIYEKNKQRERDRSYVFSVLLMLWRINSLLSEYLRLLEKQKPNVVVRFRKGPSLGEGRDIYSLELNPFEGMAQKDRYICAATISAALFNAGGKSYLLEKAMMDIGKIDLLEYPGAIIADQIMMLFFSFEDFKVESKDVLKITQYQPDVLDDTLNGFFTSFINFFNMASDFSINTNDFYKSLSVPHDS